MTSNPTHAVWTLGEFVGQISLVDNPPKKGELKQTPDVEKAFREILSTLSVTFPTQDQWWTDARLAPYR